ncbi:MAG: dethiobiotin synthase [Saprospirales bacterium TMED214]|nr:MAG: dethiobiotin synthase [Saprospirales bacterium TMED214]
MTVVHRKPPKLFFAGTDTDVGKTYVASLAARLIVDHGIKLGVYKPVASGCHAEQGQLLAEDALSLWKAARKPLSLEQVCPQRFKAPLAPPEAAALEKTQVDAGQLVDGIRIWEQNSELVVVEGAGGLFSPLADGILNIDLAMELNASVIVVAANRLGAIHQTIATCEAAAKRGTQPVGIVLCDPTGTADDSAKSNSEQIEKYCSVPILGSIPFNGTEQDAEFLRSLLDHFDT